jgi:hypothetical protein
MNTAQKEIVARPRVTISIPEDIYEYLVKRAETEIRPVSNLVEYFVVTTVKNQPDWQEASEEQKK